MCSQGRPPGHWSPELTRSWLDWCFHQWKPRYHLRQFRYQTESHLQNRLSVGTPIFSGKSLGMGTSLQRLHVNVGIAVGLGDETDKLVPAGEREIVAGLLGVAR